MGKGGVDETHPLVVGVYSGASSDDGVRRMVERSDLVLELGVDINDITTGAFTLGVADERRIAVDHTGLRVGFRDFPGVGLDDLLDGLEARPPPRGAPPKRLPSAWARGDDGDRRITSDLVAARLDAFLRPADILVSDVGVGAHLAMDVRLKRARQFHIERLYVGMGFAVPAAIGARLARGRGRPVVLVGDGSFQMTGMDLSTAVSQGLDPIVLVLDNHGYGAERAIVERAVQRRRSLGLLGGRRGARRRSACASRHPASSTRPSPRRARGSAGRGSSRSISTPMTPRGRSGRSARASSA